MPVEMTCLYAYLKNHFTTNYLQLQVINGFKYEKMKVIIKMGIFITHLRLGNMVYSNIFNKVSICNFVKKKYNISSSNEQKCILLMSAVDVYV